MEKKTTKYKTTLELDKAISYLSDIVASLRAGTISVKRGEDAIVLEPEATVKVELEAVQKGERESIKLEISWRKGGTVDQNGSFEISSKAPQTGLPAADA